MNLEISFLFKYNFFLFHFMFFANLLSFFFQFYCHFTFALQFSTLLTLSQTLTFSNNPIFTLLSLKDFDQIKILHLESSLIRLKVFKVVSLGDWTWKLQDCIADSCIVVADQMEEMKAVLQDVEHDPNADNDVLFNADEVSSLLNLWQCKVPSKVHIFGWRLFLMVVCGFEYPLYSLFGSVFE